MIGYDVPGEGKKHGPQPYCGYVSDLCEIYECLPALGGLEDQDYGLVRGMTEYRQAKLVKRIEESGSETERQYLAQHPEMGAVLESLHETQRILYAKPELARAVAALELAEMEWERDSE